MVGDLLLRLLFQVKPDERRMVTSGNAATSPPSRSLRLANSDTITTTQAVSKYLVIN